MQKKFIVSIPIVIEKIFVVISLLFLSGAILPLLNEAGEYITSKIILLCIQTVILFLIGVWLIKILHTAIREKLLWVLIALAIFSILWSPLPLATLRSSIFLVEITLFAVYLTARFTFKEQLQLLAWTFACAGLLSIVAALALPSYGIMGMGNALTPEAIIHAGTWRGIYIHKNTFGRVMVLSALVFLIFVTGSHLERWIGLIGLGLSVSLIALSTSKTALVVLLAIIALLPLYRALRWNYTIALPFFITVILLSSSAAVVLVDNAESIASALGRDLTLTGRTYIWIAVIDKIQEHPWLGYGYDSFWRAGWIGDAADIWSMLRFEVAHSHNGFLDLTLDTGLVGTSIFILSFGNTCLQAIKYIRATKTSKGLFPILFLTLLLIVNLTESSLTRIPIFWILYVMVVFITKNYQEKAILLNKFKFDDNIITRKNNFQSKRKKFFVKKQ